MHYIVKIVWPAAKLLHDQCHPSKTGKKALSVLDCLPIIITNKAGYIKPKSFPILKTTKTRCLTITNIISYCDI